MKRGRWRLIDDDSGDRSGYFDAVTARYALACDPTIDSLAITCCDHAPELVCDKYRVDGAGVRALKLGPARDLAHQEQMTKFLRGVRSDLMFVTARDVPRWISEALGKPIAIESHGPTASDKRSRP